MTTIPPLSRLSHLSLSDPGNWSPAQAEAVLTQWEARNPPVQQALAALRQALRTCARGTVETEEGGWQWDHALGELVSSEALPDIAMPATVLAAMLLADEVAEEAISEAEVEGQVMVQDVLDQVLSLVTYLVQAKVRLALLYPGDPGYEDVRPALPVRRPGQIWDAPRATHVPPPAPTPFVHYWFGDYVWLPGHAYDAFGRRCETPPGLDVCACGYYHLAPAGA